MQLALLASHPENPFSKPRFWTQLDAECVKDNRIGRGVFGSYVVRSHGARARFVPFALRRSAFPWLAHARVRRRFKTASGQPTLTMIGRGAGDRKLTFHPKVL
jgi:hypothetical protein